MTKDEVLKLAQEVCPYFDERLKGAFYEGFITALDHIPDTTKMIDTGTDRGAWDDVPDATKWVDELRGDEEPPNSTTDVVEPVAWMYVNRDGECEQIEFGTAFDDPSVTLLYTAPPKREWVELTFEEADRLASRYSSGFRSDHNDALHLVGDVEALLKEKNT